MPARLHEEAVRSARNAMTEGRHTVGYHLTETDMRCAVAAFLRTWKPSEDAEQCCAAFVEYEIKLRQAARKTASELEQP